MTDTSKHGEAWETVASEDILGPYLFKTYLNDNFTVLLITFSLQRWKHLNTTFRCFICLLDKGTLLFNCSVFYVRCLLHTAYTHANYNPKLMFSDIMQIAYNLQKKISNMQIIIKNICTDVYRIFNTQVAKCFRKYNSITTVYSTVLRHYILEY